MSKGKAPKYDANAATAAQTAANTQAMQANAKAANRFGLFGATTTNTDASGNPTGQTQSLNEGLTTAGGNVQNAVQGASSWLPTSAFSLNDVPSGVDVGNALYNQSMSYLKPQFDQQNKSLEVRLSERGLPIGSEAWGDATANLADSQNRTMQSLAAQSTLASTQEQQRQIQNALLERNQGYQDVSTGLGLLGGFQGLAPAYPGLPSTQPVDAMGAYNQQYQSEQNAYNQQQSGLQNALKMGLGLITAPMTGGTSLLGMGASALGSSGLFNSGATQPQYLSPAAQYASPAWDW